ncbi:unnamed protein product [Rhizophagus irregularis]|nr:unnamed protein product [Rhizophagus irregularis]
MDDCNRMQMQQLISSNQHFLKIKPEKDHQFCIWCISYSLQSERQTKFIYTLEKEQSSPSSLESAWKCNPKIRDLKVWELTQQKNKETMQKLQSYSELVATLKNDYKFRDFYKPTDGWLIDQENKEHFNEKYSITNIYPLFVDHSEMVVFFLDDRDILFAWCEMTREMDIWGINKMEGIANYLYHPEKVCVIMNDGELVTRVELVCHIEKERAEEKLIKES